MSKTLTVAEAWTLWWTVHVHVRKMLTHTPRATLSHFDPDESWHCHLEICLCNQKISSDGKSRLGSEWFSENIMLLNLDWTQRSSYHPKKMKVFGLNHKDFWSWSICLKKGIHKININMWSGVRMLCFEQTMQYVRVVINMWWTPGRRVRLKTKLVQQWRSVRQSLWPVTHSRLTHKSWLF